MTLMVRNHRVCSLSSVKPSKTHLLFAFPSSRKVQKLNPKATHEQAVCVCVLKKENTRREANKYHHGRDQRRNSEIDRERARLRDRGVLMADRERSEHA